MPHLRKSCRRSRALILSCLRCHLAPLVSAFHAIDPGIGPEHTRQKRSMRLPSDSKLMLRARRLRDWVVVHQTNGDGDAP